MTVQLEAMAEFQQRIKYVNTFKHNFDHNEKLDLLLYIYNYGSKLEKLLHMQKWNKLP